MPHYFYWHLAQRLIRLCWGLPIRTWVRVPPLTKFFCAGYRDVTGLNFTGFPDPDFYLILKCRIPEPDSGTSLAGYFGFVRLFGNFFQCLQRVPLQFFFYFAKEWMFKNSQRAPLLHFLALCDLPETKKNRQKFRKKNRIFFQFFPNAGAVEENTWHFEFLTLFLSLRYGADLGRSRLVFNKAATNNTSATPKPLDAKYPLGCRLLGRIYLLF